MKPEEISSEWYDYDIRYDIIRIYDSILILPWFRRKNGQMNEWMNEWRTTIYTKKTNLPCSCFLSEKLVAMNDETWRLLLSPVSPNSQVLRGQWHSNHGLWLHLWRTPRQMMFFFPVARHLVSWEQNQVLVLLMFVYVHPIWGNDPIWLISVKWIETTN